MTKFNRKNDGVWIEGKLSQKRDDSYVATKISVRDNEWKGEINNVINNVTFSVTVPADRTLTLTGPQANSFSEGKAIRAVRISNGAETDLNVSGSVVTFTSGTYKVRIEMRKSASGVEQSVVFPNNSIVTSIDDVSGYRGSVFPRASSSKLEAVPDYLPENITSLASAFSGCSLFNQELNWDTSNVVSMQAMFQGCTTFNQPVNFDTSNVVLMNDMFYVCRAFNQSINLDTPNVKHMGNMFFGCAAFNQSINLDTSNVVLMNHMFYGCTAFNQPVNFDTSNVTEMGSMFTSCPTFNHPVNFDTSKVTNMTNMFHGCTAFNQPLNFDTSNVVLMNDMFTACQAFNQNISTWDVANVTNWNSFRQGSGLSDANTPPKFL